MEVKPGYKRTEVGVIPEEWEVSSLADVTETSRPISYGIVQTGQNVPNGIPCIRVVDIDDGRISTDDLVRTSKEISDSYRRTVLRAGDLVMPLRGKVGDVAEVDSNLDGANLTRGVALISVQRHLSSSYFRHALSSPKARRRLEQSMNGSALQEIPIAALRSFQIAHPASLEEQRAIATALSVVDALLTQLDRLIAKKRDIKQAAMQQLLTGKTRLPGFGGEWQVRRLGEISHIKTGARNNEDKTPKGRYPFFVRSENVERIDSYSHDCEAILVPGEGRIGEIFHYIEGRFDVHQRVYAITQFAPNVSGRFIHFYMALRFGPWAMQNTVKATVDSLRLPTFQSFELKLPPTREEQTAIATLLSDLDAELSALDARRDKTRALNLGMMQELLTGRTRLV